jgi:hypothetical protein
MLSYISNDDNIESLILFKVGELSDIDDDVLSIPFAFTKVRYSIALVQSLLVSP